MSRRPSSLFRGSELPRLLFLLAIVVAGWPMVALFARPGAEEKPAPAPVLAARIAPVRPDEGPEFQAVSDKTPVQLRESGAYGELLRRARETPARDLAASSRRDLLYTHLWERPRLYRGVPVHLEGTAKRILTYEVNPSLAPGGRLYEAWIYSEENRTFPYVLIFEEPPAGLPIGPDLFVRVDFDGYFLKLLGYHAGDKLRAAPMLIGRLRSIAPQAPATPPMVEARNFARQHAVLLISLLVGAYLAFRVGTQVRRAFAPRRPTPSPLSDVPESSPEQVAEWLRNLPDEDDEPGFEEPNPSDPPDLRPR